MAADLTLKVEQYMCEPCSLKQGTPVTELVRMIPRSIIFNGKLVGDEYYCCPICFEPKFSVKTRTKVSAKRATPAEGPSGPGPAKRTRKGHLKAV